MAQFDVYRNPHHASPVRYLLDVQHDMFAGLRTRVVVPLVAAGRTKPMTRLNPVFEIEGKKVVMSTTELAGIALRDVGKKVGSLEPERTQIIAALDYVFTGV
jgi:toxin CcdB